jgi:hypothetical protein
VFFSLWWGSHTKKSVVGSLTKGPAGLWAFIFEVGAAHLGWRYTEEV